MQLRQLSLSNVHHFDDEGDDKSVDGTKSQSRQCYKHKEGWCTRVGTSVVNQGGMLCATSISNSKANAARDNKKRHGSQMTTVHMIEVFTLGK